MLTAYNILSILAILCIIGVLITFMFNTIKHKYKLKRSTKQISEYKITLIIDSNNDAHEFIDDNNKYLKEAIRGNNDYLYDKYENTYVKVSEIVSIQQFIFKKTNKYYKGEFIRSDNSYHTLDGTEYNK